MPKLPPKPPRVVSIEGFFQVHVTEYNVLVTRITYMITIQYVIYGLVGAYLAFAVQASKTLSAITLIWASLLVFQLLAWAFSQTLWEMFTIVDYIEKKVKPRIEPYMGASYFWEWDQFLGSRTENRFVGYERRFGAPILFAFGVFVAAYWAVPIIRHNVWNWRDTLWVIANIYVLVMLIGKALDIWALRTPHGWISVIAFVKRLASRASIRMRGIRRTGTS